jgi:dihydroorotate dehydrogenase (fumarate)
MTVDLRTTYLGFPLANPLVASSSPLTGTIDGLRRLEDAGAAAVVLPSLFQEQISNESDEPERRVDLLVEAKETLGIPLVASLNGTSRGPWVRYAKVLQEAGADAVELNVYFLATDLEMTSTMVELQHLDLIEAVRGELSIPLSVKLSPYFNAFAHMAHLTVRAGADGLVMFNRFYQPDIDLEAGELRAAPSPSNPQELRTALRWIAVLHRQVDASLAATGGIHSSSDALKVIAAGGNAAMLASALLIRGPDHIGNVLHGMRTWLDMHGYGTLSELRGSFSHHVSPDPGGLERSMYMEAITNSLKDPRDLSSFRPAQ